MVTMFSEEISRKQAREWVLSHRPAVEAVDPFGHVVEDIVFNVQNTSELMQPQNWNDTLRRVLLLVDAHEVKDFSIMRDGQTNAIMGIQFTYGRVVNFVVTPTQHDA